MRVCHTQQQVPVQRMETQTTFSLSLSQREMWLLTKFLGIFSERDVSKAVAESNYTISTVPVIAITEELRKWQKSTYDELVTAARAAELSYRSDKTDFVSK